MDVSTRPVAHGNRIGGAAAPAAGGASFELHPPLAAEAPLGTWPRSDARDVRAALAAAAEGGERWAEVPSGRRRALLREAAEWIEADVEGRVLVARALGLRPEETEVHLRGLPRSLERRQPPQGEEAGAGEGVQLALPDWTALFRGTLLAVAQGLAAGRATLLLADARLPLPADRVAQALEAAGLPPGALNVVHGAHGDALPAAVAAPEVGELVASGAEGRIAALRRLAQERVARGVRPLALRLDVPRPRARAVRPGTDPDLAAEELALGAFGRVRTLSGQLPGRIGRALVPPRLLSRLTERLLETLEASPDVQEPVPLVDRAAVAEVKEAWALGIDEGATLVWGGEVWRPERAGEGAERARTPAGERRLRPTVFTNVEPTMEIARRAVPGPVLCLVRDLGEGGAGPATGVPEA